MSKKWLVLMMVMVMACRALVLAKGIADGIVRCGDGMDDPFLHKGLQGAVHGHPVKFFPGAFFNVRMGQGPFFLQE